MYVRAVEYTKRYKISWQTLRRWADAGKVKHIVTPSGYFLYELAPPNDEEKSVDREDSVILYARESSSHQMEALERQVQLLQSKFPKAKLYRDIGSGLDFHREGLCALLDHVMSGSVTKVVVTCTDRLARFGVDLIEWIFKKHNVELVVLCNENQGSGSPGRFIKDELHDDLVALCGFFCAKEPGRRAARVEATGKDQGAGEGYCDKENRVESTNRKKRRAEELDGDMQMDILSSTRSRSSACSGL